MTVFSHQYRKALNNFLEKLSDVNKQTVLEYLNRECTKRGLSEKRKIKHIRIMARMLEVIGNKDLMTINQEDGEKAFFWLKNFDYTDDTKEDYWHVIKINGINNEDFRHCYDNLLRKGAIFEPSPAFVKKVNR